MAAQVTMQHEILKKARNCLSLMAPNGGPPAQTHKTAQCLILMAVPTMEILKMASVTAQEHIALQVGRSMLANGAMAKCMVLENTIGQVEKSLRVTMSMARGMDGAFTSELMAKLKSPNMRMALALDGESGGAPTALKTGISKEELL